MKSFLIILLLLFFNNSFSQDRTAKVIDTLTISSYSNLDKKIAYEITNKTFNFLRKKSDKKLTLIYTYAMWCAPCKKTFPKILKIVKDNTDYIDFYLILTERKRKEVLNTAIYLNKIQDFEYPFFNISNEYSKKMVKKYDFFIQKIVPGHKDYGLSLIILIDENGTPIYASTYNDKKEDIIKVLKDKIKTATNTGYK